MIRSTLDQLLEMSHYTKNNLVTPLVLQYETLIKYYSPKYVMGRMYSFYVKGDEK